jgi:penicillin-binding protein 2
MQQQESDRVRSFTRRGIVLGGAQLALFGALAGRLYHLQVQKGSEYSLLAEDNRVNQRLLIPARGRILDRKSRPLAINIPTYRVRIVPEQARDVPGTLERLSRIVTIEPERIAELNVQANALSPFMPIMVREDLTWEEVALIAVNTPDLPGVMLDAGLLRQYPQGPVLAHILGYVGAVSEAEQTEDRDPLLRLPDFRIGKTGIERSYDKVLRGRSGLSQVEVNALGREIREVERREGEPGGDIGLSLDLELQQFCFERLSLELSASAVVLDVRSGGILALASVPSYDPSLFTNGLKRSVWTELSTSPRTPLVNKCIRGQYPPGSTFKMMTAMAALEAGIITPSYRAHCSGSTWIGAAEFHCWKDHGHGRLDLLQALGQSCDVYFYDVARRTGIDTIAAMANRFGLGQVLGVDLPGEQPGNIPTTAWKKQRFGVGWHKGETLVCGIGQGYVNATPLQLAVMAARLATGRKIVPALVHGPVTAPPEPLGVSQANLEAVLRGMREVVHGARGTARQAALDLPGIEVAGKTGTSQVRRMTATERAMGAERRKKLEVPWIQRDHALFVCFAPYQDPRYAVSVVVEHGVGGAKVAAPIARDIMRKALELEPAGTKSPIAGRGAERPGQA